MATRRVGSKPGGSRKKSNCGGPFGEDPKSISGNGLTSAFGG